MNSDILRKSDSLFLRLLISIAGIFFMPAISFKKDKARMIANPFETQTDGCKAATGIR